ncbi:MAG TPA: hypothetical protein VKU41_29505 [Polyangiaceae bacterium]|nr:hypothetical protein [Polyangiaceae bacterium]
MKTVVQLRRPTGGGDALRCELVHGGPTAIVAGKLGPVAVFEPGQVVALSLRRGRRERLFVFRTLAVDDRLAASVPGVQPRVRLLFHFHTALRLRRGRGLFAYLARTGRDPSALPDVFYFRVSAVLGGRRLQHKVLLSLLSPPELPSPPWTS